jgi:hypothetical protein
LSQNSIGARSSTWSSAAVCSCPSTAHWRCLGVDHPQRARGCRRAEAGPSDVGGGGTRRASATVYFNVTRTPRHAHQDEDRPSLSQLGRDHERIHDDRHTRGRRSSAVTTPPRALGGTFQQIITKQFTASGSGTVYGAGVFD